MAWLLSVVLAGTLVGGSPLAAVFDIGPETFPETSGVSLREESEITEQTFPLNPSGRVEVSNINGSIEVEAWDRPEVKLISKKVANTKERLAGIEVKVSSTAEHLKVEVDYKRWKGKWVNGDSLYVNFSLMVPRTAVLDEIESVNGGVNVTGTTNVTKVSVVNGSIRAVDLKGNVGLSTVNGSLVAEFKSITPQSVISLETVNGTAEVRLPSNVDATVKADSVNGSISNGYGLPVRKGEYVGRDLFGRIGSGSSKIRMNSVNGSLKITRLDDGLPVSPSENLLPSKTSDDFEDSFNGRRPAAEDFDREIAMETARAALEIQKEAIESAASTASEAAKINAEAVRSALGSVELAEVDQQRIAAEAIRSALSSVELAEIDETRIASELARVRRNIFGSRAAPYVEETTRTVPVVGMPNIEVEANGANVTVKGWDRKEVKYTVTRLARGRRSPVENIDFNEEKGTIVLKVRLAPDAVNDEILEQVRVEIYAPRNSNFEITTKREIRVQGIDGKLTLNGKTGSIDVRDSSGSLEINSKTSLVRVIGFEGTVEAVGYKGDLYLEGNFKRISSKSESGTVFLTVGDETGATIRTNRMASKSSKLVKDSEGAWKMGDGKAEYEFTFTTGKLELRSPGSLATK